MANWDHVKIVKQGAVALRAWRDKYPDVRLDLNLADLRETDSHRLVHGEGAGAAAERTDDALPMSVNLAGIAVTALLCLLYFRFSVLAGERITFFYPGAEVELAISCGWKFAPSTRRAAV